MSTLLTAAAGLACNPEGQPYVALIGCQITGYDSHMVSCTLIAPLHTNDNFHSEDPVNDTPDDAPYAA